LPRRQQVFGAVVGVSVEKLGEGLVVRVGLEKLGEGRVPLALL